MLSVLLKDIKRVTKKFNSKRACTSRVYEYLLPTYTFAPPEVSKYRQTYT